MKIIDYKNDNRWQLCDEAHRASCIAPNWFIGLLYREYYNIENISNIKYAVETGTHRGYTTKFLCDHFEKVYSIEKYPDQNYYGDTSLREIYKQLESENSNLLINIGDSSQILPELLKAHSSDPFVFIFDAHNGPDGPLLEELTIVATHSNNKEHVIVIDDWGDFKTQQDMLKTKILNINPNYHIEESLFGRCGIVIAYIKKHE